MQKEFSQSRGWRFPMYSGAKSSFIQDMGFQNESGFAPGVSTFTKDENGEIYRVAKASLGPYDPFCSAWHLFALLGDGVSDWAPKYKYD